MLILQIDLLAVIETLSLVTIAVSAVAAVLLGHRWLNSVPERALTRERLDVYKDLARDIIRLNRRAVELDDEDTLEDAHEKLVLNQESELEPLLDDVTETFHRSYYLLDTSVRDAVSEYVDYVSSYQERGLDVGRILSLSGNVVQAMRDDLGLPNIFSDAEDL